VTRVLEILREELRRSLVLCGVPSVDRVSREILLVDRNSPIRLS
jgi:isopentenyl diphosphate isomerase/L-lactate dehydrogenase-like FMN-dependent dehydrogenase